MISLEKRLSTAYLYNESSKSGCLIDENSSTGLFATLHNNDHALHMIQEDWHEYVPLSAIEIMKTLPECKRFIVIKTIKTKIITTPICICEDECKK